MAYIGALSTRTSSTSPLLARTTSSTSPLPARTTSFSTSISTLQKPTLPRTKTRIPSPAQTLPSSKSKTMTPALRALIDRAIKGILSGLDPTTALLEAGSDEGYNEISAAAKAGNALAIQIIAELDAAVAASKGQADNSKMLMAGGLLGAGLLGYLLLKKKK